MSPPVAVILALAFATLTLAGLGWCSSRALSYGGGLGWLARRFLRTRPARVRSLPPSVVRALPAASEVAER